MGNNKKKNKKKGKGAEKTAAKTDKKLCNKLKKELEAIGEDNIENILAEIEKEENKRQQCVEKVIDSPTRRVNFTFIPHPDKDELILYGGEFFDGQKTFVYNDLMFYNIPNKTWHVVKSPKGPPPRCGHQMIATSMNKGQLWLFGGEFASVSQSQFYHYRDLWLYHIDEKRWEKINAPNGPSARSGHRMILIKKQIYLFGGFHDNTRDYKYFNDVHRFDIETYTWSQIEATGNAPAPRSGCLMVPLNDGKILIHGGYSKERIAGADKGCVHADSYILQPDKNDATGTKFKWVRTKIGGVQVSPRCGTTAVPSSNNNQAYAFGGVFDVEDDDDDDIAGNFYDDLFCLDLAKIAWRTVILTGKRDGRSKKKTDFEDTKEVVEMDEEKIETETTIVDDGVFKVTIGGSGGTNADSSIRAEGSGRCEPSKQLRPSARINCGLAVKRGILYLYGGMYEEGEKQITLCDFYALDLRRLDEWRLLMDDDRKQEWLGSESEDDDDETEEEESSDESGEDEEMDTS